MEQFQRFNKDILGALLLAAIGAVVAIEGYTYHLGTPVRMGPGLVPFVLGLLMILVAILIAATAGMSAPRFPAKKKEARDSRGTIRGWVCILGGVVSFVVLGRYGGLVPASFVTVFVSALGDREATIKGSALLALVLTVCGVLIFHYALRIQLPLLQWG